MLKKLQDEMRQNSLEKIKENNKRIDELEERGLRLFAIEQQDIDEILEREIGKLVAHVESKQGEASIVLGTIK